jgi:hypothetical protein
MWKATSPLLRARKFLPFSCCPFFSLGLFSLVFKHAHSSLFGETVVPVCVCVCACAGTCLCVRALMSFNCGRYESVNRAMPGSYYSDVERTIYLTFVILTEVLLLGACSPLDLRICMPTAECMHVHLHKCCLPLYLRSCRTQAKALTLCCFSPRLFLTGSRCWYHERFISSYLATTPLTRASRSLVRTSASTMSFSSRSASSLASSTGAST